MDIDLRSRKQNNWQKPFGAVGKGNHRRIFKTVCRKGILSYGLFFRFKNEWHKFAEYVSEYTTELSSIGDKIAEKKFMK